MTSPCQSGSAFHLDRPVAIALPQGRLRGPPAAIALPMPDTRARLAFFSRSSRSCRYESRIARRRVFLN
ncbi:conserved hypothetical protein [Burkholderia pseudomallei MSHR346]|nr:conserved hypothetical protein [Burkholderia pseudomallei MSHR346]